MATVYNINICFIMSLIMKLLLSGGVRGGQPARPLLPPSQLVPHRFPSARVRAPPNLPPQLPEYWLRGWAWWAG